MAPVRARGPARGGAAGIVGFLVGLAAGAVVLTALYNVSNGSILAAALWHGSWNWVATSDALQGPWVAVMTAIIKVVAPVLIWLWGPRNLAPNARPFVPAPGPASPADRMLAIR